MASNWSSESSEDEDDYCDMESCEEHSSKSEKITKLSCNHNLCTSCIQLVVKNVISKTSKPQDMVVTCPIDESSVIDVSILEDAIPPYLYRELLKQTKGKAEKTESEKITCPKCQGFSTEDKDCCMRTCTKCDYIFCAICQSDYHGFECKSNHELQQQNAQDFDEITAAAQFAGFLNFKDDDTVNQVSVKISCCMCLDDVEYDQSVDFGCTHLNSCKNCTKQFFETMIEAGDIRGLKCPETGCGWDAPQQLIKDLVDPILYDRLDQLLFASALTDMPEIVKCPKPQCQKLLTAEPEYGYCDDCEYRFCTGCNQAYHGATPCGLTEEELKIYMARYAAAEDEAERTRLENEMKGKRKQENDASENLIRSIYKKCPTCRTDIEKITGCNKMQCTSCQTFFCYTCGVKITTQDPYAHFRSSNCGLFEVPPE